jgi:CheY-like chemotaxis protein
MRELTKNILFVEDSDAIGLLMVRILNSTKLNGFNFETKWEGVSINALKIIKNLEERVDLVITDNIMPNVSGAEIIEAVLKNRPGVPIVGASGSMDYFKEDITAKLGERCPKMIVVGTEDQFCYSPQKDILLIAKPFKPEDIRVMLACIFR